MAKYRTPADYHIYNLPRQARARRNANTTSSYRTAPKPIWRNDLLALSAVGEARTPDLGKREQAQIERRWRYIPARREALVPALIAAVRHLRKLILENETLASVECVAWWSRPDEVSDILPIPVPALGSYLESCEGHVSRARGAGVAGKI
jgi:hypothetical protein